MVRFVNKGRLPNVDDLGISMAQNPMDLETIEDARGQISLYHSTDHLRIYPPSVTQLSLHNTIRIMYDLYMVTQSSILTQLHKLDISHSCGITEVLSILLCHSLPNLESPILSNCGLNENDLKSLAKANEKGRLPNLKHLDISQNMFRNNLKKLFGNELDGQFELKWMYLLSFNVDQNSADCLNDLSDMTKKGCLGSLQELKISIDINNSYHAGSKWPRLTDLYIRSKSTRVDDEKLFSVVDKLIKENSFPSLLNIFVNRDWVDSKMQYLLFNRYQSAITPCAKRKHWPDLAPLYANTIQKRQEIEDFLMKLFDVRLRMRSINL